jgi:Protein of unknown function (DUF3592)
MTTGTEQKGPLMRVGLMMLVLFLGLCTVFASVVTVAEAWQEHLQARWPEVTARVDTCGLDQRSTDRWEKYYYIHCRLSYALGVEQNVTNVYSTDVLSSDIWRNPPNQIQPLEEWVDEHPPGTSIVVHYDPADHTQVALVATDMPRGGPRTPSNMKLLKFVAGSFLVLLTIGRITRPRSLGQSGCSSMPLNP